MRAEEGAARLEGSGRPTLEQKRDTTNAGVSRQRSMRSGFSVSSPQRQKTRGDVCVVCWRTPTDPAHLIPRSLAPDDDGDPLRVVALCRQHHREYDEGALDLLQHLGVRHRAEIARAVLVHPGGILGALQRITNRKWMPV